MIIYNVTIKLEPVIEEAWLEWMYLEHMPEVMATGCFVQARIFRLLEPNDLDGPTYAVQYSAESITDYENYLQHFSGPLRKKSIEKWGNFFVAFRTLMEEL